MTNNTVRTPESIATAVLGHWLTDLSDNRTVHTMLTEAATEARKVPDTERTPEQIAMQVYMGVHSFPVPLDGDLMRDLIKRGILAGIQSAWESWEPDDYAPQEERPKRIEVGAIVEHIHNPELDSRRVIAIGDGWVWLDFQQTQLDAGDAPTRLPIENYRRIA